MQSLRKFKNITKQVITIEDKINFKALINVGKLRISSGSYSNWIELHVQSDQHHKLLSDQRQDVIFPERKSHKSISKAHFCLRHCLRVHNAYLFAKFTNGFCFLRFRPNNKARKRRYKQQISCLYQSI